MRVALFALVLVASAVAASRAANILAPIWFVSKSHFIMYERLFKELAARGHNVTVLSHFPQKAPVHNYNDISLAGSESLYVNNVTVEQVLREFRTTVLGTVAGWLEYAEMCRRMFAQPQVQQLVHSDEHYDLVIVELFYVDCMVAFAHKFQAPLIGIVSSVALPWSHDRIANPDHPAYSQTYFTEVMPPFSFWERLLHTAAHVATRLGHWYFADLTVDGIVRHNFGEGVPPNAELVRNTSLLLVNSQWSVDQALPTVPALVEVGGLHVQKPKPLPQDLKKFLDDSSHGALFFSLGSMIRCDSFSPEKLRAVLDVLSELPQRVVWKVDPATLPPLPPNVIAYSWIPQNDVLNHPNVKLFITHGGRLGMHEAITAGLPMLVVPFFGDQYSNAVKAVANGHALQLTYEDLTYETFRNCISVLLNDERYRARAQQLSALFRDRPRPPLEEAVYWVQYVLRHRGAGHLRSAALDLAWYQYLLLDVAALVLGVSCLGLLAVYTLLRNIMVLTMSKSNTREKIKSN